MVAEEGNQAGSSAGLLFWATDYQNYTLFSVDPRSSKFAVFQEVDGKSKTLIDWSSTSLLDTGSNKPNLIGVALRSDRAAFLINGHQVGEITPSGTPAGQAVGFDSYAGKNGPGNFGFAHLVVTPPEAGDLPPGTSAAPTTAPGQTIFGDDFKALDPSWGIANASTYVANGRLELRSAGDDGEVDAINNKFAYDTADIDATFVEEAGDTHGPLGGILFWASDAAHYTLFGVDPISGKFAAFDQVGDKSDTLLHWAPSATISQGLNMPNRLRVSLTSDKAILFINGQQVGILDKPATIPGKLIGLYAGGAKQPGSFGFSDFAVKALGGATAVAEAAPPPPAAPVAGAPATSIPAHAAAASSPADNSPASAAGPTTTPVVEPQASAHGTQSSPGSAHGGPSSSTGAGSPQHETSSAEQSPAPAGPEAPAASPGAAAAPPAPVAASPQQAAGAPAQMCPGQVVFEDDFQNMDRAWGPRDQNAFVTPNHAFGLAAGANRTNGRINWTSRYRDVDVCVNAFASIYKDPSDLGGLLFWGDGNNDNYFFAVTADGHFSVLRFQNGQRPSQLIPWTATSALKLGKSVPNALEVSLRGNQATIIINGTVVGSFAGVPPEKGGLIGLQVAASHATAWGFYHLVVSSPGPTARTAIAQSASQTVQTTTTTSSGPPPSAGACSGQVLYRDDFATLSPSWTSSGQSAYVKDNALMLTAAPGFTTAISNLKARYGDADICIDAGSPLQPDVAGSGGLIFWAADAQNFYTFAVANGLYAVLRYATGEVSDVVPWTPSPAIKTGAGIWNTLEVNTVGHTASVSINSQLLATVQGVPPAKGGLVALIAAAPKATATSWAFARLRIADPGAPPVAGNREIPATAATPGAGSSSH
jgi:hypothetical protein